MNVIVYSENGWEGWGTIKTESDVESLSARTVLLGNDVQIDLDDDMGCIYNEETKVISFINVDFVKKSSHEIARALKNEDCEYTIKPIL